MISAFDPQRVPVPAGPLPAVDAGALRAVGVELPLLLAATAKLSGGKGVLHRPRSSPGSCRRAAQSGLSREVVIAEVYDRICPACRRLPLPAVVRSLWQAAAQAGALLSALADAEHLAHARAAMPHLAFARLRALAGDRDDQLVHAWVAIAASHPRYRAEAGAVAAAWDRARARHRDLLQWLAGTCPPLASAGVVRDVAAGLGAATDPLAPDGRTVAALSRRLARAADLPAEPWVVVSSAWSAARELGGGPEEALAAALAALDAQLAGARVVDVRALPAPVLDGSGFASPAQWADSELARWAPSAGTAWCGQLEAALRDAGRGEDGEQMLVTVLTWPLTLDQDADLAHLSLVEPLAVVPYGGRDGGHVNFAAVLALPAAVAHRAVRAGAGRVVADPGADDDDFVARAAELARGLFPYRPADADTDAGAVPSAAVEQARASARGDQALWVPDGHGIAGLAEALAGLDRDQVLALTVECGTRDKPVLASLSGTVTDTDATESLVLFAPWGGHDPLPVPVHRIAALLRPEKAKSGTVPVWAPAA
ncbi:hypothetical protein ACPC54_18645 [Kitasatospora sp. NPDC094028]